MKEVSLKVKRRDIGKQNAKSYRRNGMVPGIYYTKGEENVNIMSDPLSLRPVVYTSLTRIVDMQIEGEEETRKCVLKTVDFDPITEEIVHFDMLGIKPGEKLTVKVPFKLVGQPVGVRNGGLLAPSVYKARITCLPKDLPETLEIDISELKIGDSAYIRDIQIDGVEIHLPDDAIICSVVRPRVAGDGGDLEDEDEESGEESAEATEETTEE